MIRDIVNKWNNLTESVKASIVFTFSSFFIKGISFITTPIFTRIMDTTQYGIISTYNAWSLLIEVFAVLGMTSAGIINIGLNDYKEKRYEYLSSIVGLGNLITVLTFLILFVINNVFKEPIILPNTLLLIMFIHYFFYPAQIYWITKQRYEIKYKLASLLSIVSVLLGQIMAVLVVLKSTEDKGVYKIWASEVGALMVAIPLYYVIVVKGKNFFNCKIWKEVLILALPLIPHYLAQHLMSSADRIMIANMVSEADAGIYNLVFNIGWLATLVWTAINSSLTPFLFEEFNCKKYEKTKNVINKVIIGFSILCFVLCIMAPEILYILAPEEYHVGLYVIPPIVGVAYLNGLYNVYASVEFYYKKVSYIAKATVIAAILNIVLNAIFIPQFSYIGAAYTTFVSNIAVIVLHYRGYRQALAERAFDDAFIFRYSTFVCVLLVLSSLLYINTIARYCVILIAIILLVIFRKKLSDLFKIIKKK